MGEAKGNSVQHLARCLVVGGLLKTARCPAAIDWITNHWAAQMLEMHADLVGATCVQRGLNERGSVEHLYDSKIGARSPASLHHSHFFSMDRMPCNGCIHRALCLGRMPAHESLIDLSGLAISKLG